MQSLKVGVDIGGTFTDVIALNESGKLWAAKGSSTPDDFRLGRESAARSPNGGALKVRRNITPDLGELNVHAENQIGCIHCRTPICSVADNWRKKMERRESDLTSYLDKLGVWVQSRAPEALHFVEFFCPGSAMLLDTETVRPDTAQQQIREAS